METPKIVIKGFEAGIAQNPYKSISNGFAWCSGIDTFSEKGVVKPYPTLDSMSESSTNGITSNVRSITRYYTGGERIYYALGDSGKIYDYNKTESGVWALAHTDANSSATFSSIISFNGNLHWASNGYLGKFDGTTWTNSYKTFKTGANYHPMIIYEDLLVIGDGRYVALLDTSGAFNDEALDLPEGYEIRTLANYGGKVYIAAWSDDNNETLVVSWDTIASSYNIEFRLKQEVIVGMIQYQGLLLLFADSTGNIYQYNGSVKRKLITLPGTEPVYFNTGGIAQMGSNLLFTTWSTESQEKSQVWALVDNGTNYSFWLSSIASSTSLIGLTGAETSNYYYFYGLYVNGINDFVVGYQTSDGSVKGIMSTKKGISYNSAYGVLKTQIYTISPVDEMIQARGVEVVADKLGSSTGNYIDIYYRLNENSSWTNLGKITYKNQDRVFWGIKNTAKTIQLKLILKESDIKPKVHEIRIY